MQEIQLNKIYRHFKGKDYKTIHIAIREPYNFFK